MFYKIIIAIWFVGAMSDFALDVMKGDTVLEPLIGNTLATMAGGAAILIQFTVLWVILFHTSIRDRF